jgi:hypothetical protein
MSSPSAPKLRPQLTKGKDMSNARLSPTARYEYRTGEIRAALRKHGTIAGAARALRIDHRDLARFCSAWDIPADRDIPYWFCPGFLKLPPIDGRDELPGMLKP